MKKETWIYLLILAAMIPGWIFFEWLNGRINPRSSGRRALFFILIFIVFMLVYTGGIIFLVRLIFGKPS